MTDVEQRGVHERYLHELLMAAGRDGSITDQEHALLLKVAEALHLDAGLLEEEVRPFLKEARSFRLDEEMAVCFTGEATYSDGTLIPRDALCRIARGLGLRVVDSVTKKGCDVVVAADPRSLSGKASTARAYGIPLVGVRDFVCADIGATIPSH